MTAPALPSPRPGAVAQDKGSEWEPNPAPWGSVALDCGSASRHAPFPGPWGGKEAPPRTGSGSSTGPGCKSGLLQTLSQSSKVSAHSGHKSHSADNDTTPPCGTGLLESGPCCWGLSTKHLPSGKARQDRRCTALDKESGERASLPLCPRAPGDAWQASLGHLESPRSRLDG